MTKETKKEPENKGPIVFYCKDCEKIVDATKSGRRYVYSCNVCGTKNVAFGTEKSITSFFRVKEEKKEEEKEEAPEKEEEAPKEEAPKEEAPAPKEEAPEKKEEK